MTTPTPRLRPSPGFRWLRRAGALACLLAAIPSIPAQAGVRYFGRAYCPVRSAPLIIRGTPKIGSSYEVETLGSGKRGNPGVYLFAGISDRSVGGIPLPFDASYLSRTSPWPVFHCGLVLQSGDIMLTSPRADGLIRIRIDVPPVPALVGKRLFHQTLKCSSSLRGSECYWSRAAEITIQP